VANIIETKQVAIKDLPEGYFKERLTELATSPDVEVCVVATKGGYEDWAAYLGWPRSINDIKPEAQENARYYVARMSNPAGVASHGDKLSAKEAKFLWPWIGLKYRP
jgi:hypothetical protein